MHQISPKLSINAFASDGAYLLTKVLVLILFVSIFLTTSFSQDVTVKVTTNPKEIKKILSKEGEGVRRNRAFFDEDDRCRGLLQAREWLKAEASCRLAITLVEKLPSEHVLERSSARTSLGIALLWQRKTQEAIPLFKTALAIRLPSAGESDADTADIYSLLGNSYGALSDIQTSRSYFEKAEISYRSAFTSIGDDGDDIRFSYPRRLKNSLQAHYHFVRGAGLSDEAEKLQIRMAQVEKEFAKYLVN